MVIFYHVVNTHSFSGAARQLGIARSAISRHISLLEKNIGVRLLNRTTRRLSLTEAGETYYQSCARIVAEAEIAANRVNELQDEPVGTLKVSIRPPMSLVRAYQSIAGAVENAPVFV
jgi:DNA-binding transcriptional LysR family regulator